MLVWFSCIIFNVSCSDQCLLNGSLIYTPCILVADILRVLLQNRDASFDSLRRSLTSGIGFDGSSRCRSVCLKGLNKSLRGFT
jgi:hypothetical protein